MFCVLQKLALFNDLIKCPKCRENLTGIFPFTSQWTTSKRRSLNVERALLATCGKHEAKHSHPHVLFNGSTVVFVAFISGIFLLENGSFVEIK